MLLQIHLLHEHQRAVHEAALQLAPVLLMAGHRMIISKTN